MSVASLLHDDGDNIIVSIGYLQENGEVAWVHRQFTSVIQAQQYAENEAPKTCNIYFKHANHDGSLNAKAKPAVGVAHFPASRSLFVDVDTGPTKPYATIPDAARALSNALAATDALSIPRPNLIQVSGGGLHVCWVLSEILPSDEWKRTTDLLQLLLRNGGLSLDGSVKSIDKGIRASGSVPFYNYNHGAPSLIRVLRENPRIDVGLFRAAINRNQLRPVAQPSSDPYAKFSVYKEHEFDLAIAVQHCEMLKVTLRDNGASDPDDYGPWSEKIALVAKAADVEYGRKIAHDLSSGHHLYDPDKVDEKFDSFLNSGVKKYVLCKTFAAHVNSVCHTCAYHEQVNSPAGIASKLSKQRVGKDNDGKDPFLNISRNEDATAGITDAASELPTTLYYNSEQGLRRIKLNDDMPDVIVWSQVNIFHVKLTQDDSGRGEHLEFQYQKIAYKNVSLELSALADARSMALQLAKGYFIILKEHEKKPVYNAMVTWVEALRRKQASRGVATDKHYTNMGWSSDLTAFVLGSKIYGDSTVSDTKETSEFNPRGSIARQQEIVNRLLATEQRPEAHAFVAASLAAPLLKLVGCPGMSLNLYSSRSGHGKTSLARLGASFWGIPGASMIGLDDTNNAVIRRVARLHNTPAIFDELRVADPQEYVRNIVFRMASGAEKQRLNSDSSPQQSGSWQTLMLFATNFSFSGLVGGKSGQGDAVNARFMDFALPPLADTRGSISIGMDISDLDHHCGWIGHEFIKHVISNRAPLITQLTGASSRLFDLAKTGNNDASGRNHILASACLLVAAHTAAQLNLFPINSRLVLQAIKTSIDVGKSSRIEAQAAIAPSAALAEFIKKNEGKRIVTVQNNKVRAFLTAPRNSAGTIAYEVDRTAKELLIDYVEFSQWLRDEGFNIADTLNGLTEFNKGHRRAFGRGTALATTLRRVIVVPLDRDEYAPLLGGN